jgi:hypothetical protein
VRTKGRRKIPSTKSQISPDYRKKEKNFSLADPSGFAEKKKNAKEWLDSFCYGILINLALLRVLCGLEGKRARQLTETSLLGNWAWEFIGCWAFGIWVFSFVQAGYTVKFQERYFPKASRLGWSRPISCGSIV